MTSTGKTNMKKTDTKSAQPEALAQFAKSARNAGKDAAAPGLTADEETAPVPADPDVEHTAATKVLREGVFKHDEGSQDEIEKLPDRITKEHSK
jgi:hypothetical protein